MAERLGRYGFVRSHGLGNDYLVMDPATLEFALSPTRIRLICDRHTGVGSDGILVPAPAGEAEFGLRILNPDGSEAEKSGNGLRIFAKFLYDHGYTDRTELTIRTAGGLVRAKLLLEEGRVTGAQVEMGRAVIDRGLPALEVAGRRLEVTSLSVGNPHCVVLGPLDRAEFFRLGPLLERHPEFPARTNVQFAEVLSRSRVRALIWERGAGHTLASGSSSCAVAVACFDRGLVESPVTVEMEGGELTIAVSAGLDLVMTGPVEEVCTGILSPDLIARLRALPE